jgi:hypothetical protein
MPSTATTRTVTGLTNGTAYVFRVAGINGIGTGAYSTASAAVTPTAGDALFSSVQLLLPMDGTGATFVDASAVPKTVTAYGSATQSTTQSKFGGKSLYRGVNGTVNTGIGMDGFGSQDFVIEGWFYVESASSYNWFYGSRLSAIEGGVHFNFYDGVWHSEFSTGSGWRRISGLSVPTRQWFHYAFVRNGTSVTTYINGASQGSVNVGTLALTGDAGAIMLFSANTATGPSGDGVTGYIDDFRITVGNNRGYTGSTITVPTAAFLTS